MHFRLSFEPTVPSMELLENQEAENQNVTRWGFVLLGFGIIAGIIYFLLPRIRETLFWKKLLRMAPAGSAAAVFRRMRHILKLSESITVRELAERSAPFFTEPDLFEALDILLYSHDSDTVMSSQQIAQLYQTWYDNRVLFLKEQAQKRRQETKLNRKKQKTQNA